MTEILSRVAPGGGMLYPHNGIWPEVHETAFIAPGSQVIGDVVIGAGSSIWFNCVLRGDVAKIRVGENSNIQDGSVVHVDGGGIDTIIGNEVLIGHMAMVHGTTIEDRGFVGLSSVTMDGCYIETDGMLAAGALLSPGKRIGNGEMWIGRPAKKVRDLDDDFKAGMLSGTHHYRDLAQKYLSELQK